MQHGLWLSSCFLIVAGFILFVSGLVIKEVRKRNAYYKGQVRAKVVELILMEDESGKVSPYRNRYYPVIEYYAEGKLHSHQLVSGSYPSSYKVGQELQLIYMEGDPDDFLIVPTDFLFYLPLLLYIIGVIMIAVGALFFIRFAFRA